MAGAVNRRWLSQSCRRSSIQNDAFSAPSHFFDASPRDIERFYNPKRRHCMSPIEFERQAGLA